MSRGYVTRFALVALATAALAPIGAEAQTCTDRNLLANLRVSTYSGVDRVDVLTDGRVPVDGSPYDNATTSVFRGENAHAIFDLGELRTIRGLYLQADNNDEYHLFISENGRDFVHAFIAPSTATPGMQPRIGRDFEWQARYVRIEPRGGDASFSVSELALYCQLPDPFPPPFEVVAPLADDMLASQVRAQSSWNALIALAAIPLLFLAMKLSGKRRVWLCLALVVVGYGGWIRFGRFHEGLFIHPWDSFHYFMGPKYFGELGYSQLYNCVVEHERAANRAQPIEQGQMRDLSTNVLHAGSWSRSHEARCQAHFTTARRRAFDADIEAFRPLFPRQLPFYRMVVDHGYNGTPPLTAFLKVFTHFTPASKGALFAIAFLDLLAYAGAIAALWWGFGPLAGALAAIVLGMGEPWTYLWTGGSVGRAVWLFFLCAGVALLAKRRTATGGAALAVSALLRLFPAMFAGSLGLFAVVRAWRQRRLAGVERSAIVGLVGATIAGVLIGGAVAGFDAYGGFVREIRGHTSLVMSNHLGFEVLMSYVPGATSTTMTDARLTDPHEPLKIVQRRVRAERRPLWLAAVVLSLAMIVAYAWREDAKPWVAVLMGAPLLYATIAHANYDGVWVVVLSPLAIGSRRRIVWLLGFVAATRLLSLYAEDIETKHVVLSAMLGAFLLGFFLDVWRDLRAGTPLETTAETGSGSGDDARHFRGC